MFSIVWDSTIEK
jgi:hypothetical protein